MRAPRGALAAEAAHLLTSGPGAGVPVGAGGRLACTPELPEPLPDEGIAVEQAEHDHVSDRFLLYSWPAAPVLFSFLFLGRSYGQRLQLHARYFTATTERDAFLRMLWELPGRHIGETKVDREWALVTAHPPAESIAETALQLVDAPALLNTDNLGALRSLVRNGNDNAVITLLDHVSSPNLDAAQRLAGWRLLAESQAALNLVIERFDRYLHSETPEIRAAAEQGKRIAESLRTRVSAEEASTEAVRALMDAFCW